MDPIHFANISRAQSALQAIVTDSSERAKRSAFIDAAFTILAGGEKSAGQHALSVHRNPIIQKAVGHAVIDTEWDGAVSQLAEHYLPSIAEHSLLDLIARYARLLPNGRFGNALVATGTVGDIVAEGAPKPVRRLGLSLNIADEPTKAVGIVVLSNELVREGGQPVRELFERELQAAVIRSSNVSVLDAIVTSDAATIDGAAFDPLAALRAGLQAAEASDGFVVAAPTGDVAALATSSEALPGFTVRGGEFRGGIHVVAVDGADHMTIIPASRFALWVGPLEVHSAGHALVEMIDEPGGEPRMVSLWQENLLGLRCERSWRLAQADAVVVVSRK